MVVVVPVLGVESWWLLTVLRSFSYCLDFFLARSFWRWCFLVSEEEREEIWLSEVEADEADAES